MSSKSNISIERQLHYAEKGEQGGVDIRNPSTALLGISSIDRYRTGLTSAQTNPGLPDPNALSSPYDFQITTQQQNLMTGFFTRLAVNEVQFRWTIPTITARNNKIYINVAPYTNTNVTNVAHATSTTTFTLASTTGYVAGQTIVASGFTSVSGVEINGVYTIASVTGTTLVCDDPNGLPDFTTTAYTGKVVVRALITIPDGWYDIYNQDGSSLDPAEQTDSKFGNLAYALQTAVRSSPTISALMLGVGGDANDGNGFIVRYNLNYQGVENNGSLTYAVGQPYNTFFAGNLLSTGLSSFYWSRYTEPTRPNAVGLYEQMAWANNQSLATFQYSSPNASMLSTPFVDICCDGLTYNQALKDSDTGDISRTMLCRVFLTPDGFTGNVANLGSAPILIHRQFPFPKQIKWNANQPIGNLRFQVYDSQGYLVSTYEGAVSGPITNPITYYDSDMGDWSLTLLISEV
jgi:hypothetical protein